MGWDGPQLSKPPTGYENWRVVSAAWHYESQLLLETPKASYEKIKGTWKGENKECVNTTRLYVNESFSGELFFLQLMIMLDDLYYGGDFENNTWIEQYMIDLPVNREIGIKGDGQKVNAKNFLSKFTKIIDKGKDIFYMRDEFGIESQWFDYMKIYNFYEYYWYLAEYEIGWLLYL